MKKLKFKNLFILAGLFGIIGSLVACTTPNSNDSQTTASKTIKIGIIAPISGPASNYGEDIVNTYQKVLKKFEEERKNEKDVKDIDIKLIIEDGKCDGKDATSAAQKLINIDKVDVIIGGVCSNETIPAGKLAQTKHVTLLSPTSSAPGISDIGDYVFRYYNDIEATKSIAKLFRKNNADTIAIVTENTDVCTNYGKKIKENFDANYIVDEKYSADEKDFSIIAKRIAAHIDEIDYLAIVPNSDVTFIGMMKALANEGILDELKGKIIGNELLASDATIELLGEQMEGVMTAMFISPSDIESKALENFITEFSEEYGILSSDLVVALGAEALQTILEAVEDGAESSEDFKNYLTNINEKNPKEGLVGTYRFNEYGDGQGIDFMIKQVQNGELVLLQ